MTEAMADENRTPEQEACDNIDAMLERAGWNVADVHHRARTGSFFLTEAYCGWRQHRS